MKINIRKKYLIYPLIFSMFVLILSTSACSRIRGTKVYTVDHPKVVRFNCGKNVPASTNEQITKAMFETAESSAHWELKKRDEKSYLLKFTSGDRSFTHIVWVEEGKLSLFYYDSKNYGYSGDRISYKYWRILGSFLKKTVRLQCATQNQ